MKYSARFRWRSLSCTFLDRGSASTRALVLRSLAAQTDKLCSGCVARLELSCMRYLRQAGSESALAVICAVSVMAATSSSAHVELPKRSVCATTRVTAIEGRRGHFRFPRLYIVAKVRHCVVSVCVGAKVPQEIAAHSEHVPKEALIDVSANEIPIRSQS